MLEGTRGSPKAPTKMASKSRANLATPSGGTVILSARSRSAPQSNDVNSAAVSAAWMTLTAGGMTSFPIPSPAITAIGLLGLTLATLAQAWNFHKLPLIKLLEYCRLAEQRPAVWRAPVRYNQRLNL